MIKTSSHRNWIKYVIQHKNVSLVHELSEEMVFKKYM